MRETAAAPLRIGVDGFNIAMPRGTGVATYGRMLARALRGMGYSVDMLFGIDVGPGLPDLLREALFFDRFDSGLPQPAPKPATPAWWGERALPRLGSLASEIPVTGRVVTASLAGRLPEFDRLLNIAGLFTRAERHFRRTRRFLTVRIPDPPHVMHWTYPLPIRLAGARNVYTLHDMVPLRLPYTTLDHKRSYLRLVQGCVRWGDHVCTVSEASRRDIAGLLAVPDNRITNTYQSAQLPAPPVPPAELADWLEGLFGLQHGGYYLFYAALEPKKNLGRLIEAYLSTNLDSPLVIVGARSWRAEDELRLLSSAKDGFNQVGARIRLLEYVPGPWLAGLVTGARAVLFPSLYEGFGLPVLEAMQLGTPVVTSSQSSLPEVAGDAAVLVDAYDINSMAGALRAIDGDAGMRARLAGEGLMQAARFDQAQYQRRLEQLYARVSSAQRGVAAGPGIG
jgi:glycosyltransferase involved in cell wall biosynthesis